MKDKDAKVMTRRNDEQNYFAVPYPFLEKLEPIFKKQGFEYEIFSGDNIPDDAPQCVEFEGMRFWYGVACIRSHINQEDLYSLMCKIWNPKKYGTIGEV